MKSTNLRNLKIKLANLQLEIQALIEKGERNPHLIDAIAADIADFTDEVTKIRKQIADKSKKIKESSMNLMELYKSIKK